jgi:hypothetical protein
MRKKYKKIFFCILKINEERSRIRPDQDPLVRGTDTGTGSALKYHVSPRLIRTHISLFFL